MRSTEIIDAPGGGGLRAYLQIARFDHWFKNVFMLLGVVLAVFYEPELLSWRSVPVLALAFLATCLIASSNYVLNELLDGPQDKAHPTKRHRPVPSGLINPTFAYVEWLLFFAAGMAVALAINPYFAATALWLWVMGVLYNVRPFRTKEWPYLDVLSESVNNPIRLLLGWFALITTLYPPVSLILAYWMIGAFFMAMKRYAEYRHIGDPVAAGIYRRSFRYYTEDRLLISILFYATACAFFAGIFVVRYHLELILIAPFVAGLFAYYLKLGLKPDSPTQNPEKLYRETSFMGYLVLCVALFVGLMFTRVPALYDAFNVQPSGTVPLWTIGTESGPR